MSFFKKLAAIAMVVSISAVTVACSNNTPKDTPSQPSTSPVPTKAPAEIKKADPVDAYHGLNLDNCTAKSDSVTKNNKRIVCTAGGWIYYEKVDFGTRGAKSISAEFKGKKDENGVVKVYIDGGANGDVSDATLIGTVDVLGGMMNFGTNLVDKIQDIHSVTLVFESEKTCLGETGGFDFAKAEFVSVTILNAEDQIEFEDLVENNGVIVENCSDATTGGKSLGGVNNDEYTSYKINFGDGGYTSIKIRAASSYAQGGDVQIYLDSLDSDMVGYCHITGTGSWSNWADFEADIEYAEELVGAHDVYLKYTNGGKYLFNLNWFKFE